MDAGLLARVPIFSNLAQTELEQLAGRMREVLILEGESLIKEGDLSYKFFAILEGVVEVRRAGLPVAELGPGDFVGEHGILARARRNAEIVATSTVKAAVAIGWDIRQLMEEYPSVRSAILRADADRQPQTS